MLPPSNILVYSAVNLGTDMLELDVHLSKDGKVVVNHDYSLLRTTGLDLRVSEVNYNELPLLNTSQTIDFDPGIDIVLIIT